MRCRQGGDIVHDTYEYSCSTGRDALDVCLCLKLRPTSHSLFDFLPFTLYLVCHTAAITPVTPTVAEAPALRSVTARPQSGLSCQGLFRHGCITTLNHRSQSIRVKVRNPAR